jgi:hypothetical protein
MNLIATVRDRFLLMYLCILDSSSPWEKLTGASLFVSHLPFSPSPSSSHPVGGGLFLDA